MNNVSKSRWIKKCKLQYGEDIGESIRRSINGDANDLIKGHYECITPFRCISSSKSMFFLVGEFFYIISNSKHPDKQFTKVFILSFSSTVNFRWISDHPMKIAYISQHNSSHFLGSPAPTYRSINFIHRSHINIMELNSHSFMIT